MEMLQAAGTDAASVRAKLERREPLWLDIDSSDPAQHALLAQVFHFHPLTIEDTLNRHTRVKVEAYDGYLLVVLRAMALSDRVHEGWRALDVSKICLFLGPGYLVSVHAGPSTIIERAAARSTADDPGLVAHAISDVAIDDYFPILDRVDAYVDELAEVHLQAMDSHRFRDALRIRRLAFTAHRSLVPQQPIFETLAQRDSDLLSREAQLYFRDVYDHVTRIIESLDSYRDFIAMMTESNIAQITTRLEYASTLFAAIATLTIPFIIISGLFGMNFSRIPLSANPYGFWIVVGVQVAVSTMLLVALRRRHLL